MRESSQSICKFFKSFVEGRSLKSSLGRYYIVKSDSCSIFLKEGDSAADADVIAVRSSYNGQDVVFYNTGSIKRSNTYSDIIDTIKSFVKEGKIIAFELPNFLSKDKDLTQLVIEELNDNNEMILRIPEGRAVICMVQHKIQRKENLFDFVPSAEERPFCWRLFPASYKDTSIKAFKENVLSSVPEALYFFGGSWFVDTGKSEFAFPEALPDVEKLRKLYKEKPLLIEDFLATESVYSLIRSEGTNLYSHQYELSSRLSVPSEHQTKKYNKKDVESGIAYDNQLKQWRDSLTTYLEPFSYTNFSSYFWSTLYTVTNQEVHSHLYINPVTKDFYVFGTISTEVGPQFDFRLAKDSTVVFNTWHKVVPICTKSEALIRRFEGN